MDSYQDSSFKQLGERILVFVFIGFAIAIFIRNLFPAAGIVSTGSYNIVTCPWTFPHHFPVPPPITPFAPAKGLVEKRPDP